jgi:hypothetical protein
MGSPDFIADEDVAKHEGRTPAEASPDFIPDDAAGSTAHPPATKEMGWGEYLGRGTAGALPIAMGIGGGAIGALRGGYPGAVGGGALSYAGGAEIRDLLNAYVYGDKNPSTKHLDQLKRVLGNMRDGAEQEMGGAIGGNLLSRALSKLPSIAEGFTIRHLRPTPNTARVLGKDKMHDVAREVLDSGAMKFGGKADQTLENVGDLKDAAGNVIGDQINASKATVDPVAIANQFDKEVIAPLRETSGNESIIKHLEGQKQSFLDKYAPELKANEMLEKYGAKGELKPKPMTAAQIEAQKRMEQDRVNYNAAEPKLNQKAQMDWATLLKNEGEKAVDNPAFPAAKRSFGNLAAAEGMLGRTSALTDSGNGLLGHLADMGISLEALRQLATGNPIGLGMLGVRALTKGRVASAAGKGIDSLSKVLPKTSAGGNLWNEIFKRGGRVPTRGE